MVVVVVEADGASRGWSVSARVSRGRDPSRDFGVRVGAAYSRRLVDDEQALERLYQSSQSCLPRGYGMVSSRVVSKPHHGRVPV